MLKTQMKFEIQIKSKIRAPKKSKENRANLGRPFAHLTAQTRAWKTRPDKERERRRTAEGCRPLTPRRARGATRGSQRDRSADVGPTRS